MRLPPLHSSPMTRLPWIGGALLLVTAAGCVCLHAEFPESTRAAERLPDEISRLAPSCAQWFVRECTADGVDAVWLFRPRINGPAEAAAYDRLSGELLYQRQFGVGSGWSFTPVRQVGVAPPCRPELDSSAAERACAWFEKFGIATAATPPPAPAETATPPVSQPAAPAVSPVPTP